MCPRETVVKVFRHLTGCWKGPAQRHSLAT
jgi:hypothetical protein